MFVSLCRLGVACALYRYALDRFSRVEGRTIWIADAHRDDGKRYVVHADELLTAFLELERAVCIQLLIEQI